MLHEDELSVNEETVRALISEQFPQWARESVVPVRGLGTVNAIYRVGSHMAARFPLQAANPEDELRRLHIEGEAMSELSSVSPFPTPELVAIGKPGDGYPLPWSVQTWLPGDVASPDGTSESHSLALDLATLIRALRTADTRDRHFAGAGRGGTLPDHDDWVQHCFSKSEAFMDVAPFRSLWARFRELPSAGPNVMSHCDLIPANLLVAEGRIVGVLDGGGFAPADPALDLVAAWHLLGREERETVRSELRCDVVEWRRGAAWALQQAMGLVWYYRRSMPEISAFGHSTLRRLQGDPDL